MLGTVMRPDGEQTMATGGAVVRWRGGLDGLGGYSVQRIDGSVESKLQCVRSIGRGGVGMAGVDGATAMLGCN